MKGRVQTISLRRTTTEEATVTVFVPEHYTADQARQTAEAAVPYGGWGMHRAVVDTIAVTTDIDNAAVVEVTP